MSYLYLRAKYRSFLYWWCIENTSRRHIINMLTRYTNAQIQNTLVVVVNTLSTVLTFKMTVLPKNWLFSQLKFKSLFLGPHSSEVWLQRTLLGFFAPWRNWSTILDHPLNAKRTHTGLIHTIELAFWWKKVSKAKELLWLSEEEIPSKCIPSDLNPFNPK